MKAVEQTLQVTSAMNLISTAKLRKGRRLLADTEPYFNRIQKTMSDLLAGAGTVESDFFRKPAAGGRGGRTAIVAVTSDKGLAGGYNANIFKYVTGICEGLKNPMLLLIGAVGQRYFVKSPYLVLENFSFNSRLPTMEDAQEITDYIISQFDWGVFDEVRIVYTHMWSTLKMLPEERLVLPLDEEKMRVKTTAAGAQSGEGFEYIPSAKAVFDALAPQYIKGLIYGCITESYASEQSSRMSAMDEASRNAREMLASQQLHYNRVRQAGITQEVTEIVSGSAALGG
jgi:F-type H+-transporting ATPase subunit gamma